MRYAAQLEAQAREATVQVMGSRYHALVAMVADRCQWRDVVRLARLIYMYGVEGACAERAFLRDALALWSEHRAECTFHAMRADCGIHHRQEYQLTSCGGLS